MAQHACRLTGYEQVGRRGQIPPELVEAVALCMPGAAHEASGAVEDEAAEVVARKASSFVRVVALLRMLVCHCWRCFISRLRTAATARLCIAELLFAPRWMCCFERVD